MPTNQETEDHNRKKYEEELAVYGINKDADPHDYFRKLIDIKLNLVRQYAPGKRILDLGCGGGDYLFEMIKMISSGVGIDYTDKSINAANAKKVSLGISNLDFIKANARQMPFKGGEFDLVFSFSALAHMPHFKEAIQEIARVLKPGGIAVLEIGNWRSLNTLVCLDAQDRLARPCHVKLEDARKIFKKSNLHLIKSRAFGILPFWGDGPRWLSPLLHPRLKKIFQQEINGRMIDEWLSNMFLFKPWAYRHFMICRKI